MNAAAVDADLLRRYRYLFDLGGNRTQEIATVGATTTTDYEYTSANQIYRRRVNAGSWTNFTYDNNGNLTSDGTNTHTWDRANRLLSVGSTSYKYDGYGNRFERIVSGTITKYLLDLQPGLPVVVAETVGANVNRLVHTLRGLHAQKDPTNNWEWMMQDGLGSIRGVESNAGAVLESRNYEPYGNGFNPTGTSQTDYGFTGEPTDSNGLLYLRARYYSPATGSFTTLDPFEGLWNSPMTINGFSYVNGNPTNLVDPSGYQSPDAFCVLVDNICLESLLPNFPSNQIRNFQEILGLSLGRNYSREELSDALFGSVTRAPGRGGNNDWWKIWLALMLALELMEPAIPRVDEIRRDDVDDCGCGYEAAPSATTLEKPFIQLGDVDILCWLRCYEGREEVEFYRSLGLEFAAPIIFDPALPYLGAFRKTTLEIRLWHPSMMTRADTLSTLVEEMYHAGQFYSIEGLLACRGHDGKGLLTLDAEREAKTKAREWMLKAVNGGKVSRTDFSYLTNSLFSGVEGSLFQYELEVRNGERTYAFLPHECPELPPDLLVNNPCTDTLVALHLKQGNIMI